MKRFYKETGVERTEGGWRAALDGRGIRTAGGRPQVVPTEALATALAAEWAGQGEVIDPARFHLRDLADFETDTLCYRADPDEALYKRQTQVWEPLLGGFEARLSVHFTRISGIMHKPQPAATLERLRAQLETQDAFALAALKMLSSLAASLIIALEAIRPGADAQALWQAAELEADWQVELWGEDWEATELRATRFTAFTLAMKLVELTRLP